MEFAMGRSQPKPEQPKPKSEEQSRVSRRRSVTRSAHARVGLFMCGFPTKRKWERGRDGRKEGKNYSYNSLITRRGRDNLICTELYCCGDGCVSFHDPADPTAKRASCALMRVLSQRPQYEAQELLPP